ncbi:MAG: hypothetical protein Q9159_005494 [Coniocarpon cinnabarinum]
MSLDVTLKQYEKAHPKSKSAHQKAIAHLPGGNTRTVIHASPFPLTFVEAQGAGLRTADGHTYIDFLSEYTAALLGHRNARVIKAIQDALSHGYNFGGPNPYERELASLVCQRFGPVMELVRFTNSGTEANMLAVAAAKASTGRKQGKVLVFGSGYHGSTIGFRNGNAEDPMLLPHQWLVAPYNDIQGTRAVLNSISKDQLAAILVEPMQGSGGAIPASGDFLKFLRSEATARGAILICDEVMTSRLAYSGLSQHLGVRADLITLGKWIGGGMTFGAFGGRRELMELFDPDRNDGKGLTHAGTFNNNVVTMAAGCEALKVYGRPTMERVNSLGERLKEGVNEALSQANLTGQGNTKCYMSGRGSLLAMHFDGENSDTRKALFWHHMLTRGIYLAPRGFVSLNIDHDQGHVDRFVSAVSEFAVMMAGSGHGVKARL